MPISFQPDLSVLEPPQLALWQELGEVPRPFVLYGGTAVALYLGHRKSMVRDLKKIYQAATTEEAEPALEDFVEAWDEKYPTISNRWRTKWTDIIALFDFPAPIRNAIDTTNAIELVNSVIRKFTKTVRSIPARNRPCWRPFNSSNQTRIE